MDMNSDFKMNRMEYNMDFHHSLYCDSNYPYLSSESDDEFEMEMMDRKNSIELDIEFDFHGTKQQRLLSESIKLKLLELNDKAKEEITDSPAAKHIRQTSIRLVKEAQQLLEDFIELEERCDMLIEETEWKFKQISEKIERFREMCSQFILKFQQTWTEMFPWIGVGGPEEAALAEILNKRHSSPFNSEVLKKWIRWKEREVYTVNFFTNMMINTKIVPSYYHVKSERYRAEHVVCFVFTSLGASEPYLSALSHSLNRTNPDEPQDPHSDDVEKDQWFASKEVTDEMRHKATLFRDFAEANKEKKNMKFLIWGLTDETLKGSSIYLYKEGVDVIKNFEPPSKPEAVTVSYVNHDTVRLKASPPRFGADNVDLYSVEYRVRGDDAWQREKVSNPEKVTVSGLREDTEYEFRCRAETSAWVGPHSDVTGSVRTLPCVSISLRTAKQNYTRYSRFSLSQRLQWSLPVQLPSPD